MREELLGYWNSLINDIPPELYEIALVFLLAVFVMFIGLKGLKAGLRYSIGVLVLEYIALIYCSTVFLRKTGKVVVYNYMPFWSYQAYLDGSEPNAITENFANVLVFVPLGFLASFVLRRASFFKIGLFGAFISMGIETLQLFFKKGFSEWDDVMHNTLGCVIGYGLFCITKKCLNISW